MTALSREEWTSDHEGSHAAAALVLGLPVTSMRIGATGGAMSGISPTRTPVDLHRELVVTLAPWCEAGVVPAWPPSPYALQPDERDVHALAASLGLDETGYKRVVGETCELVERAAYKRLKTALSHAAIEYGALDQRSIERIRSTHDAPKPERKVFATRWNIQPAAPHSDPDAYAQTVLDDLDRRLHTEELERELEIKDMVREQVARIEARWQDAEAKALAAQYASRGSTTRNQQPIRRKPGYGG